MYYLNYTSNHNIFTSFVLYFIFIIFLSFPSKDVKSIQRSYMLFNYKHVSLNFVFDLANDAN